MKIKSLFLLCGLGLSCLFLSSCTAKSEPKGGVIDYSNEPTTIETAPTEAPTQQEDNLLENIPTTGVKAEDQADQELLDELNQFRDDSLDKDFSEIESQL